jgi:hypothetical protein
MTEFLSNIDMHYALGLFVGIFLGWMWHGIIIEKFMR